jgi:uncharacterized membrane protein YgcG
MRIVRTIQVLLFALLTAFDRTIVPRFRAGDMAGGVAQGVDDIVTVLTGGLAAWKQRAARPQ